MIKYLVILALLVPSYSAAQYVDIRYCGEPARTSTGKIKRSSKIIRQFKELYPLPSWYVESEWYLDHTIPLDRGGCDSIVNMQWLHKSIKSCAGLYCKDRWERIVYPKRY